MLKKLFQCCYCFIMVDEEDKPKQKITWPRERFDRGVKYESKDYDTGIAYYNSEIR